MVAWYCLSCWDTHTGKHTPHSSCLPIHSWLLLSPTGPVISLAAPPSARKWHFSLLSTMQTIPRCWWQYSWAEGFESLFEAWVTALLQLQKGKELQYPKDVCSCSQCPPRPQCSICSPESCNSLSQWPQAQLHCLLCLPGFIIQKVAHVGVCQPLKASCLMQVYRQSLHLQAKASTRLHITQLHKAELGMDWEQRAGFPHRSKSENFSRGLDLLGLHPIVYWEENTSSICSSS